MKLASVILPLFAASYVTAHGILRRISIQGKDFEGDQVGSNGAPSVIRQVSTQDPNKGANNPALTCGPNSGPAALVADANPGDTITFDWRTASDGLWPHNTGPMLTYMASCGSVTCDKFNQADAQWFKIDQVGRKANSAQWVQEDLKNGGVASVQIPKNLAAGNYLIRHEIIALHLATSFNGAEFYPGCAQLRVGGNGNGTPKASDLVKLPGAYSDNDPGIFDPSVFDAGAPYTFPGPAVATLVAGTPSTPSDSPSSSSTSAAPAASSSASKKTCRRKKKTATAAAAAATPSTGDGYNVTARAVPVARDEVEPYRPRRLSHIMRRLAFEKGIH